MKQVDSLFSSDNMLNKLADNTVESTKATNLLALSIIEQNKKMDNQTKKLDVIIDLLKNMYGENPVISFDSFVKKHNLSRNVLQLDSDGKSGEVYATGDDTGRLRIMDAKGSPVMTFITLNETGGYNGWYEITTSDKRKMKQIYINNLSIDNGVLFTFKRKTDGSLYNNILDVENNHAYTTLGKNGLYSASCEDTGLWLKLDKLGAVTTADVEISYWV